MPHATTILDNTHISAAQTLFDQNKPPGKTITYSGLSDDRPVDLHASR